MVSGKNFPNVTDELCKTDSNSKIQNFRKKNLCVTSKKKKAFHIAIYLIYRPNDKSFCDVEKVQLQRRKMEKPFNLLKMNGLTSVIT